MEGSYGGQPGSELSPYLRETPSCNHGHPAIQELLHSIVGDSTDEANKAIKIFYYVRDSVRFALMGSGFEITASNTAMVRYGDCGSKTNYQMALLRAAGIPARMRAIMAYFSALNGLMPGFLSVMAKLFNVTDFHFWPECTSPGGG